MQTSDLQHVLLDIVRPTQAAIHAGGTATRSQLTQLHRAARQLLLMTGNSFQQTSLLEDVLKATEEGSLLQALTSQLLDSFRALVEERLALAKVADVAGSRPKDEALARTAANDVEVSTTPVSDPNTSAAEKRPGYALMFLVVAIGLIGVALTLAVTRKNQDSSPMVTCTPPMQAVPYRNSAVCLNSADVAYLVCLENAKLSEIADKIKREVSSGASAEADQAKLSAEAESSLVRSLGIKYGNANDRDVIDGCNRKYNPVPSAPTEPTKRPADIAPAPSTSDKPKPVKTCWFASATFSSAEAKCSAPLKSRAADDLEVKRLKSIKEFKDCSYFRTCAP